MKAFNMRPTLKALVRVLDGALLNGVLEQSWQARRTSLLEKQLGYPPGHKLVWYSKHSDSSLLASLCDKYGSDKGSANAGKRVYAWEPHNYTQLYSLLFQHRRFAVDKVFECGIGTNFADVPHNMGAGGRPGASLRVWRDYFPNAMIIGADIDRRILFSEERIETYCLDQTDPQSIKAFWDRVELTDFELMIDDGLHTFEAGRCLLENSMSRLAESGIYVVEDVVESDLVRYCRFLDDNEYHYSIVRFFKSGVSMEYNSMIVIKK